MVKEAALITASAVLFVQMGLSSAIQEILHFHSKIASCPKCVAFWSTLAYSISTGHGIIVSVSASFISAYAALWLSLLYDALAVLYNLCYEQISETPGAADAEAGEGQPSTTTSADEVPQM